MRTETAASPGMEKGIPEWTRSLRERVVRVAILREDTPCPGDFAINSFVSERTFLFVGTISRKPEESPFATMPSISESISRDPVYDFERSIPLKKIISEVNITSGEGR